MGSIGKKGNSRRGIKAEVGLHPGDYTRTLLFCQERDVMASCIYWPKAVQMFKFEQPPDMQC